MENLQRISLENPAVCPCFAYSSYFLFCSKNGAQEAAGSNLLTRTNKVRYFGKNYRNGGLFVYYATPRKMGNIPLDGM